MQANSVPKLDGTGPTYVTPAASDTAPAGSVLVVKNASASPITVTLTPSKTLETGDAYPAKVHTVAASGEKWIPILKVYADPVTGLATAAFSATASVTAAAVWFTAV